MESFDLMPLACIINGKFIAIHGGISPDLKTVIYSITMPSPRSKTSRKLTASMSLLGSDCFAIYFGATPSNKIKGILTAGGSKMKSGDAAGSLAMKQLTSFSRGIV